MRSRNQVSARIHVLGQMTTPEIDMIAQRRV